MDKHTKKHLAPHSFGSGLILFLALFFLSSAPAISQEDGAVDEDVETVDTTNRIQEDVVATCENVVNELHFGSIAAGTPRGSDGDVPPYLVPLAGSVFESPDVRHNTFPLTSWVETIYPPFNIETPYDLNDYNGVNGFATAETEPPENHEQLNLVQGSRVRPTFGYGASNFRYRHRDTDLIKPVDLNPWYLTSLQGIEIEQPASPYLGTVYRGSRNFHRHRNRLTNVVSSAPRGSGGLIQRNSSDGCERIIETIEAALPYRSPIVPHTQPDGFTPPNYLDPVWNRMELDNCASQFILGRARQVRSIYQHQGEKAFVSIEEQGGDSDSRGERVSQKFCQPFRMVPLQHSEQEYFPSEYLMFSWNKLLFEPAFLLRNGAAAKEPNYALNGVRIPDDQKIEIPSINAPYNVAIEDPTNVQVSRSLEDFPDIRTSFTAYFDFLRNNVRSYRPPTDLTYNFQSVERTSEFTSGTICVNDVTERQYERILDPSHPFTPRWDFTINDRDFYSPMTIAYGGDPLDQVRCAGAPNSLGGTYAEGGVENGTGSGPALANYDNESGNLPPSLGEGAYPTEEEATEAATLLINEIRINREELRDSAFISNLTSEFIPKVDILTWRQAAFNDVIAQRILFNIICYYTTLPSGVSCWEELECGDNTAGDQESGQCCATNWNGEDAPLISENYLIQEVCGGETIRNACAAIARPLAPMNPLKLVPAEPENVPEGYHFSSYFGVHRPYLRCWDMGKECGNLDPTGALTDAELGESLAGSTYAVAGIGRHIPGDLGPHADGDKCRIGGGGNRQSVLNPGVRFGLLAEQEEEAQITPLIDDIQTTLDITLRANSADATADPITSWAELKLYQSRGIRDFSLNCFIKHEALFKQGTGEEIILGRSGGEFQTIALDSSGRRTQVESEAWPLSWRGYISDSEPTLRFPNYASPSGTAPIRTTGLDGALAGDLLVYNKDLVMSGSAQNRRMPHIAFVTESHTAFHGKPGLEWVRVLAFNNGRSLDTCGNNDFWGQGEEYTMWKAGIPRPLATELNTLGFPTDHYTFIQEDETELNYYGSQVEEVMAATDGAYTPGVPPPLPTCDDPGMSNCVENYWGEIPVYFAPNDLRY